MTRPDSRGYWFGEITRASIVRYMSSYEPGESGSEG